MVAICNHFAAMLLFRERDISIIYDGGTEHWRLRSLTVLLREIEGLVLERKLLIKFPLIDKGFLFISSDGVLMFLLKLCRSQSLAQACIHQR